MAALKLDPRTRARTERTRRQRPSEPLNSTTTRIGLDGWTRPESRSRVPRGTRRRRGTRSFTVAITATFATTELALPVRARTAPERRHGTWTAQAPSEPAVARATVTQPPLLPRFCTATGMPAPAMPPERVTSPANAAGCP
jgi:hypothetical protein